MNTSLKVGGGLAAACAACCALSVVPAIVTATSVAALTSWALGGGVAALAVVAVGVVFYLTRRGDGAPVARVAIGAARRQGCGCGVADDAPETPIACTLDAGDFKQRSADIRDLARRALKEAKRTPLTLTLTYAPYVASEVQALMAMERECCPFLAFSLKQSARAAELTIVAPPSAQEAADALFDHFAPELARTKEIVS